MTYDPNDIPEDDPDHGGGRFGMVVMRCRKCRGWGSAMCKCSACFGTKLVLTTLVPTPDDPRYQHVLKSRP